MSTPKAPANETAEYIEDKTYENVPTSLHLGNDLNIYLTPEQDMEDRGRIPASIPKDHYIHKIANEHLEDINDEHLDYLGDLDDGQWCAKLGQIVIVWLVYLKRSSDMRCWG